MKTSKEKTSHRLEVWCTESEKLAWRKAYGPRGFSGKVRGLIRADLKAPRGKNNLVNG